MIIRDVDIIRRYKNGETIRQIAQTYRGDQSIVTYALARNKVPPRNNKNIEKDIYIHIKQ